MLKHDYEIKRERTMKRIADNIFYLAVCATTTAIIGVTLAGIAIPM